MPMTHEIIQAEAVVTKSETMPKAVVKPKVSFHDEAPAIISDHKFSPRGEWYTLCRHCSLAEAAHQATELRYYSDDNPDV